MSGLMATIARHNMSMSMMGSGIYSTDITLDVQCGCEYEWEQDFRTDDWGNVDEDVKCPNCDLEFNFSRERDDLNAGGADTLEEMYD
jgi:hypothetical protein